MEKLNFHAEHEDEVFEEAQKLLPQFIQLYNEGGVELLMSSIYHHTTEVLDKAGLWEKASCKGACSACCHDTIFMPSLEAEFVQSMLLEHGVTGDQRRKELQSSGEQIKWMDKACPYLLDEDEEGRRLCSIYDIRPMVCRTHNSTEDPKFCNKEDYPDRLINEGRIVHTEAITVALMMMKHDVDKHGNAVMTPIHELV